jgi:site-specific DNA recombinase
MTHTYIAYIRVSTEKQGSEGVSLAEQHRAISSYADRHHLIITAWYEERSTAAKRGRPIFKQVMKSLQRGQGRVGLLMHKIDRGARNLRDWADIGDALDQGIAVRFAHDDVDLHTRSGRLTADIQAVIAADYIRNLREEVKKGIVGRLRQGLYPFGAPRGYRNHGKGRVKTPDPIIAPLIVACFQRYATGTYSLRTLAVEMATLGLVNADDQPLRPNAMSKLLHRAFYTGIITIKGQTYTGIHQPLITEELFSSVQQMLKRRHPRKPRFRHDFRYRRCLRCLTCHTHLVGELQRGRIYYRCHICRGVSVREDRVRDMSSSATSWKLEDPRELGLEPYSMFDSPRVVANEH